MDHKSKLVETKTAMDTIEKDVMVSEESMSLFNKYDADGGGSIDIFEFIEAMLPPDFPKRTVVRNVHIGGSTHLIVTGY